MNPKSVMVITGEASGDAHAGRMITELKKMAPQVTVSGIGGDNMRAAGAEIIVNFSELAIMGIVEVAKRYRQIKKIFRQLVDRIETQRPDLLILVDYPGFNLKLAKEAKKRGIRVFYYISPKVWAWRAGRIKTIKKYVDFMAVLFPFEENIYQGAGIPVECVGHPLLDAVEKKHSNKQAKVELGYSVNQKIIGLFPGSRYSEIDKLLPVMLQAAKNMTRTHSNLQFVIPLAPGVDKNQISSQIKERGLPVSILSRDFYTITTACDAIVAASGTVTLEIALLGIPHFLVYRMSPISYQFLKRLVNIPYVGLCNIVTGQPVILELLQNDVTPERIEKELINLLNMNSKKKAEAISQQVRQALGPKGASYNCAKRVIDLLERS